jgi:hypothetical protein
MALTKTLAALNPIPWNGNPIRSPGVYSGIPLDRYHEGDMCIEPSMSSSGLRKLYSPSPFVKASPAHYWMRSPYNPERIEDAEETEWMILGRAAHHLLFGEKDFDQVFVTRPATINGETCNRVTRQGKLWHKQQDDLGLSVISMNQLKAVKGIARELMKEPLVQHGLMNGLIEHSWFCKHRSGLWLKIRPDATPNDSLDYVDLKLTKSVMWSDLQRTIRDYGYFMQAGLTAMVVRAVLGQPINSYTLVFAESTEPHCIEIVTLKENEIQRGIAACEVAIGKFLECWRNKCWPGPRGNRADAQYIEMSEFDQKRMDETLAMDRLVAEARGLRGSNK